MSVKLSCIGQAIRGYVDFSGMLLLQKVSIFLVCTKVRKSRYLRTVRFYIELYDISRSENSVLSLLTFAGCYVHL